MANEQIEQFGLDNGIVADPQRTEINPDEQQNQKVKSPYRFTRTPQPKAIHPQAHGVNNGMNTEKVDDSQFGNGWPTEIFDENFPNDINKCRKILEQVRALPVYGTKGVRLTHKQLKARQNEQQRRKNLIVEKINQLTNTPPAPKYDSHMITSIKQEQRSRPARRAERIEELKASLATVGEDLKDFKIPDNLDELGASDTEDDAIARKLLAIEPKLRLSVHPQILGLVNLARSFAMSAELFNLENHDLIYTEEHIQELEYELRNCSNPDRVRELKQLIALAKESGSNRANELAIKQESHLKWEPFFNTVKLLQAVAGKLLAGWALDAAVIENEFFAEFGLQSQRTQISSRFRVALDELKNQSVNKTSLNWFGVTDVTQFC